jgi:hypothetical protein
VCSLDIERGKRQIELELRRDGERLTLRVKTGRALVERLAMDDAALATSLGGLLVEVDPGSILSLRVDRAVTWFGEALAGLAAVLRARFGAMLTLPVIT